MKITINGGHCPGHDSGGVGSTGLQEVSVTSDMMERVAGYLRAVGYDVLTVQDNILHNITEQSNQFCADLFVAIHCNSARDGERKGTETFCDALGSESEALGTCIQRQILSSVGTEDGGVKIGNFYILRLTRCPAVLVEMAYLTNTEDELLLSDEVMRDQFAAAIARGITDYYSLV